MHLRPEQDNQLHSLDFWRRVAALAAALLLFGALCFECGARYALISQTSMAKPTVNETASSANEQTEEADLVAVYVTGAVDKPGVYWLKSSDRVDVAVKMAQPTASAVLSKVNLAQHVKDEMVVLVPATDGASQLVGGAVTGPSKSTLVNINEADQTALESLPGIGPTLASRVIDYRNKNGPFLSTEDIMKVDGIGDKKYADIKDLITVR